MKIINHFIDGKGNNSSHEISEIFNPSTGIKSGEVIMGGSDEVYQAVKAAKNAFKLWSKSGLSLRSNLLLDARNVYISKRDTLIEICVAEPTIISGIRSVIL